MKLNKKGFMMAEVIVVSAVILIFLSSLFVSYNQIYSKYKSRIKYYDAVTLYRLAYYRDALIDNHQIDNFLARAKDNKIVDVTGDKKIFIIYNAENNLMGNELDSVSDLHGTFKDYINYLAGSVKLNDSNYVMVTERCDNEDDCKYAYLAIYDGKETVNNSGNANPGSGILYRIRTCSSPKSCEAAGCASYGCKDVSTSVDEITGNESCSCSGNGDCPPVCKVRGNKCYTYWRKYACVEYKSSVEECGCGTWSEWSDYIYDSCPNNSNTQCEEKP